jgi:hypothetical protein
LKDKFSSRDLDSWNELTMTTMAIPEHLQHILAQQPRQTIIVLFTHCVMCTIVRIDMDGNGNYKTFFTDNFLAMGTSPVGPASNITLAYIELTKLGWKKCAHGMRRLIDDICICTSFFKDKEEIRQIYPKYLTLNDSADDHFLDIQMNCDADKIQYFPYVKPFNTLPLSWHSCHTKSTKIAIAQNELKRLMKNCSNTLFRAPWAKYWYNRFTLAGYPTHQLIKIDNSVRMRIRKCYDSTRNLNEDVLYHIERYRGQPTGTAEILQRSLSISVSTAWRSGKNLSKMMKRRVQKRDFNIKEFLSFYDSFFLL